jgi:hypothetical protein
MRAQADRGSAFEDLLERQNAVYRSRAVAHVVKVPTEIVVHGPMRRGMWPGAHPARKSTVDYLGVIGTPAAPGRAVALEAKSTSQDRWSPAVIPQHQREELARWHALGALAAVLLLWDGVLGPAVVWAIPWPAVAERLRARHAWRRDRPEGGVRPVPARCGPLDYLDALGVPTPRAVVAQQMRLGE